MKNNTIKNLIFLGVLVIFALNTNIASAQYFNNGYLTNYTDPYLREVTTISYPLNNYTFPVSGQYYVNYTNSNNPYGYNSNINNYPNSAVSNNTQVQPAVNTNLPYEYMDAPVNTNTQVNSQYDPYYNQQASVINSQPQPVAKTQKIVTNTKTVKIASVNKVNNTARPNNQTGDYVNYDPYSPNMLGASANGFYNGQPVGVIQNVDGNELTALSIRGSGSFLPSSVFQWILFILLLLAIIIVFRMVARTYKNDDYPVGVH